MNLISRMVFGDPISVEMGDRDADPLVVHFTVNSGYTIEDPHIETQLETTTTRAGPDRATLPAAPLLEQLPNDVLARVLDTSFPTEHRIDLLRQHMESADHIIEQYERAVELYTRIEIDTEKSVVRCRNCRRRPATRIVATYKGNGIRVGPVTIDIDVNAEWSLVTEAAEYDFDAMETTIDKDTGAITLKIPRRTDVLGVEEA